MPRAWTRLEVESLVDPRSLMRGLVYQREGRVEVEQQGSERVTAVVRGSMPYHVELRRDPKPSWSCTCPVGEDGDFCKHCVAVALARIRTLAAKAGAPERFTDLLATVTAEHGRKRNLMALIDEKRWAYE